MADPSTGEKAAAPARDDLIRYKTSGDQEILLSWTIVKDYFLPTASKQVAMSFMGFCRGSRLDPFLKEVYLVEYEPGRPQIIVAKDAFLKRAERHPAYKDYKAGLVLLKDSKEAVEFPSDPDAVVPPPFVAIEGTLYPPGYKLVGSWCTVWRRDREKPIHVALALHEYLGHRKDGTITKMWTEKEGTMIRKCALAHGHREAFPDELSGFFFEEEFGRPERELKNVTPRPKAVEPPPSVSDVIATHGGTPLVELLGWTRGALEMWYARRFAGSRDLTPETILAALREECVKAGKDPHEAGGESHGAGAGEGTTRAGTPAAAPEAAPGSNAQPKPGDEPGRGDAPPPPLDNQAAFDAMMHDYDEDDPMILACLDALGWTHAQLKDWLLGQVWQSREDILLLLDVKLEQEGKIIKPPTQPAPRPGKPAQQLEIR